MCSRWTARSSDCQSVMNRIMLRFRPIAPKPIGGDSASGAAEQDMNSTTARRTKRKYVRVRGRQSKQCKSTGITKKSTPENPGLEDETLLEKGAATTLQLLPERSESDNYEICNNSSTKKLFPEDCEADRCKGDDENPEETADYGVSTVDLKTSRSVNETWIIVESVTDKFTGTGLGFSDKEKISDLEKDTCPGFISDRTNNVIWVNEAYKRMASDQDEESTAAAEKGCLVWLVVKEELPYFCPSFACRVRVVQQRRHGQKCHKIVTCDVWRMEFAGFAWKLDVNTALSLSL